jgi:hypothetical protein
MSSSTVNKMMWSRYTVCGAIVRGDLSTFRDGTRREHCSPVSAAAKVATPGESYRLKDKRRAGLW